MVDFWDPHSSFIGRRAFVRLIVVHNFAWTAFGLLAGLVNGSTTGRTVAVFAEQRSPFRGHRYILSRPGQRGFNADNAYSDRNLGTTYIGCSSVGSIGTAFAKSRHIFGNAKIVMKIIWALAIIGASVSAHANVPPKAERGRSGADCRAAETGPAVSVSVIGLKDRKGKLILELYPDNDADFLQSDKLLIAAGKPFRRVPIAVPSAGPVSICIRAPGPGRYALALLHDRDDNGKFGLSGDGVGFANNPKLGFRKPKVKAVALSVGPGVRSMSIVMNYRQGIGVGPVKNQTTGGRP